MLVAVRENPVPLIEGFGGIVSFAGFHVEKLSAVRRWEPVDCVAIEPAIPWEDPTLER